MKENRFGYTSEECRVNIENMKVQIELTKLAYEAGLIDKEVYMDNLNNYGMELCRFKF